MVVSADACRAVGHVARLLARRRQQTWEVAQGTVRADEEAAGVLDHLGEPGEFRGMPADRPLDRLAQHRRGGAGAEGEAVRRGIGHRLGTDLAAGPGTVGDDDAGARQPGREEGRDGAGHGVHPAAGREGDDDLDRPAGGPARLGQGRAHQCGRGGGGGQDGAAAGMGMRHGVGVPPVRGFA